MIPKKYDVITLGTAVVDITAYPVERSIFDRDNTLLEEVLICPGGDAVNQAMVLGSLENSVSLCCRLGDDSLGRMLQQEVKLAGVNIDNILLAPDSVTSTAIVLVAKNGDRNIVCKKGNNYDFCIDDIDMTAIADTRTLSIASLYCITKLEKDGLEDVLIYAKKSGAVTFADCGADKKNEGIDAIAAFLPHLDYFMPSEIESAHLTGETDPKKAALLLKSYGVKNVVIKLGSKGAYADCQDFCGYIDPFSVEPKDTTGAGDAFCAGFINSVLSGKSTYDGLEFASAVGAYATLQFGASMPGLSADNIQQFITDTPKRNLY